MKEPVRVLLLLTLGLAVVLTVPGCGGPPATTCVLAPTGPSELGPATGLSTPPPDTVVFDLKYVAQTGGPGDLQYRSFWGYGGSDAEAKTDPFLESVRQKASGLYYVQHPSFSGRKWAAVEHHRRQATAFYFDVNANGKLDENERIPPTRKTPQGVEFITPDFLTGAESSGARGLCRVLLQVNFWRGNSEPNCMWSPAALLEGTAKLNGQSARLLLFANGPGGQFDQFGSSDYSLLLGDQPTPNPAQYIPRENLSSLIANEGQFYRLTIEGRRSNGLPARVLLAKDTSPTGSLAVRFAGSNSLQASLTSLYLSGVNDKTVFFRIGGSRDKVSLPVGTYALDRGDASYGSSQTRDWEVSFTKGPWATIKDGEVFEVALGQPALKVRAIEEKDRYNSQAVECATFKRGTRIYLEPRIAGKNLEVFSRFRQPEGAGGRTVDRPPKITITDSSGKQLLSTTMEYG
ncbi:MAG TPA: hypothetical protein VJA21_07465 [Verrucomicrobiae bacterium]